ncbi:MAG: GGDEF domain-containing protein [Hyphomonadaceae bacterium]
MTDTLNTFRGPEGLSTAHATIDLMGSHQVPTTAQNYEVWLSYKVGGHPDLRRIIDERIARGEAFTDDANEQLYEQFFSNIRISAQMMATGERIARELTEVVSALQNSGDKTSAYADALGVASKSLESGLDAGKLREVIAGLASATLDMADHNRLLTARLKDSSREMDTLRTALRHVRAEALTDSLTGLANRKMFDETLRMRLRENAAARADLCLILCDIDHFKRFNDTWGHQTGDQIIRFIASSLQRHAQPDHLVARYGGEEFAFIMPRTRLMGARGVAESIRTAIESKKLLRKSTNESLGKITVSMGIAQYRAGETMHDLIERADACLYASKRAGRNRISTDQEMVNLSAA